MIVNWPATSGPAGWVALQLIEDEIYVMELDADLSYYVPGVLLYVPAVRNWQVDTRSPLSTYAFVIVNEPDVTVLRLRNSRFVVDVMCQPNTRNVVRVTDAELADMVRVEPPVLVVQGDTVEITSGDWEGLEGQVEHVTDSRVIVFVGLHSGARSVELPREDVCLKDHRAA